MVGDKRKRVSSASDGVPAPPDAGSSSAPKKSRMPAAAEPSGPTINVVWELVGSTKKHTSTLDNQTLYEALSTVMSSLGASPLGLTLMHVRQGGNETPVWDNFDYQTIKDRALATRSKKEVIRVYSGAIGQRPRPLPTQAAASSGPSSSSALPPIIEPPSPARPAVAPTPRSALKAPAPAGTPRTQKRVMLDVPSSPENTPIAPLRLVPNPSGPSQSGMTAEQQKKDKKDKKKKERKKKEKDREEKTVEQLQQEKDKQAKKQVRKKKMRLEKRKSMEGNESTAPATASSPAASTSAAETPAPAPAPAPIPAVAPAVPATPVSAASPAVRAGVVPPNVAQYKPARPSPLSQSAAATEERPKKKSRLSDVPPAVGIIPVIGTVETSEPAPVPIPIPGSEPVPKGKAKAAEPAPEPKETTPKVRQRRTSGQSLLAEAQAQAEAANPAATSPAADPPVAAPVAAAAPAAAASKKTKAKAATVPVTPTPVSTKRTLVKRQSLAADIAAQIAAQFASSNAAPPAVAPIAEASPAQQVPAEDLTPETPTPKSKAAKPKKETITARILRELREKRAAEASAAQAVEAEAAPSEEAAQEATTEATAEEVAVPAAEEEAAPSATSTPVTEKRRESVAFATPTATPTANGVQSPQVNGSFAAPAADGDSADTPCATCGQHATHLQKDCPAVLAAGVEALQARLEERRAELRVMAAKNPRKGRKSNPAYEEKNDPVCETISNWIKRKTAIAEKVANGTSSPAASPKTAFKALPTPPIMEATAAAAEEPTEPSSAEESDAESGSESDASSSPKDKSSSTDTPMGPRSSMPNLASSVDTPLFPIALHQKALIRPRRPGSMSGLSVSDAVIETADSSDSSSDSDSDSISTASSSDSSDSDSSSGDETLEPADLMRRIMVENPLSKRDMKKARISAASMHHVEAESASEIDSDEEPVPRLNNKRRDSGSSIGDFEEEGAPPAEVLMVGVESDAEEDAERARLLSAVAGATQDVAPEVEEVAPESEEELDEADKADDEQEDEDEAEEDEAEAKEDKAEAEEDKAEGLEGLELEEPEQEEDPSEEEYSDDEVVAVGDSATPEDQTPELQEVAAIEAAKMEEGEGKDEDEPGLPEEVDELESINQDPVEEDLTQREPVDEDVASVNQDQDQAQDQEEDEDEAMDVDEPTPRALTTPVASPVKLMPRSSGSRGFQALPPSSPAIGDFEGDIALREAMEEDETLPATQMSDDDLPATQAQIVESQSQVIEISDDESDVQPPTSPVVPKRRGRPPKNAPKPLAPSSQSKAPASSQSTAPASSQTKAKAKAAEEAEEEEQPTLRRSGRNAGRALPSSQPSSQPARIPRTAKAPASQPEPAIRRSTRAASREPPASQPMPTRRTRAQSREPSVAPEPEPELQNAAPLPIPEDDEDEEDETTPRAANAALPPSSPHTTRRARGSISKAADSSFPGKGPLTQHSPLPPSSFPPPPLFNGHQLSDIEPTQATQSSPLTHRRTHMPESPLFMAGDSQSLMQTQAYNPNPPPLETQATQHPLMGTSSVRSLRSTRSTGSVGTASVQATPTANGTAKRGPGRPRRSSNVTAVDTVTEADQDDGATDLRADTEAASDDETNTTASFFPKFIAPRSSQVAPLPSSFPTLSALNKDSLREGTGSRLGALASSMVSGLTGGRLSLGMGMGRPSLGASSTAPGTPSTQVLGGESSGESGSDDDSSDDEPVLPAAQASRYSGNKRRESKRASMSAVNGW